jgi:hypothetical protein
MSQTVQKGLIQQVIDGEVVTIYAATSADMVVTEDGTDVQAEIASLKAAVGSGETEIAKLQRIRDELADMIRHCQSLLLTAAEEAPSAEELDAVQNRLEGLREQLENIIINNGEQDESDS